MFADLLAGIGAQDSFAFVPYLLNADIRLPDMT
jgi:hypothetical protein